MPSDSNDPKKTASKRGRPSNDHLSPLEAAGFHYGGRVNTGMPQSEYSLLAAVYRDYRRSQKLWNFSPKSRPHSEYLHRIEILLAQIRAIEHPSPIDPILDRAFEVVPSLFPQNKSNDLSETFNTLRESLESDLPYRRKRGKARTTAESETRISQAKLHAYRKACVSARHSHWEKNLLAISFQLSSILCDRLHWRKRLKSFEKGLVSAFESEVEYFNWESKRNCLIEARLQLKSLGRLEPFDLENFSTVRRSIKRRAALVYLFASHRSDEKLALREAIQNAKQIRAENWDAYLNKLPEQAFPKSGL